MLRKIVDYKLFLWHYCGFCRFIPPFNTFVLGPVQTSLDRFFPVFLDSEHYSARHHLTNTARVLPKTHQNFVRSFFRKETHEKNAFATRLYFFPRVSFFFDPNHFFFFFFTCNLKPCPLPKRNKRSQKAREREAAKRGEITPATCTYAKEISADPTYEESGGTQFSTGSLCC
jgi:hypothetical protein